jgi:hypothetical protein
VPAAVEEPRPDDLDFGRDVHRHLTSDSVCTTAS